MLSSKYRVEQFDDEIIMPEETLADALSDHSSVEVPITATAFRAFFLFIGIVLLFFIGKAVQLQAFEGERFATLADQSRLYHYGVPSVRGIIYDRNGEQLVDNVPTFDAVVFTAELEPDYSIDHLAHQLANILDMQQDDVATLLERNKKIAMHTLQKDVSKEAVIALQTDPIPGIYIVPYGQRTYVQGSLTSHVLGYTANVTPEELVISGTLTPTDRVGRLGVEASYDEYLQGPRRVFDLQSGAYYPPNVTETGSAVHLTIDTEIQQGLYNAMNGVLRENGMAKAAGVIQDVNTGAVIAMVSFPTFDPNVFERAVTEADREHRNNALTNSFKPLFNRTISGTYAAGSTIKPLWALVGLREGVVTPRTIIYSAGYIEVPSENDPSIIYRYNDWKKHGWTDVYKAIADSVDVYFYAMAGGYEEIEGVGIHALSATLRGLRAHRTLGIDLPLEAKGIVPDPEWKQEVKGEPWYIGDTYNVSIGQGDLLLTPLWLNAQVMAIANGGSLMEPYIVDHVVDNSGEVVYKHNQRVLEELPFSLTDIQIIREGMRQTITTGTGRFINSVPVPIAGKTGTAEVGNDKINALITAYAPYDEPEIAITVILEDSGVNQNLSAVVAQRFFQWYFVDRL